MNPAAPVTGPRQTMPTPVPRQAILTDAVPRHPGPQRVTRAHPGINTQVSSLFFFWGGGGKGEC